jgi:hypothetical protein
MENHTEVVKKPIYKRKWFLITVGIFVLIGFLPKGNNGDKKSETPKTMTKEDSLNLIKQDSIKKVKERKEYVEKHFSKWDGSHRGVERYIKDNMNDPDSYEHVKTTYLESPDYLVVTTKYRGKNKFGGLVLQENMFKVNYEGEVLEVLQ